MMLPLPDHKNVPTEAAVFCDLSAAGWSVTFPNLAFGELSSIYGQSSLLSVISSFGDHKNLEKYQASFFRFSSLNVRSQLFCSSSNEFGLSSYARYTSKSNFPRDNYV